MKKTANRVLAVALAFLMAFSCLTAAFAADGDKTNDFAYSSRGISEFATNAMSVKYLADMLDDMLKEMAEEDTENHSKIDVTEMVNDALGVKLVDLVIDYSSVDGIMNTVDQVCDIWNGLAIKAAKLTLGDVKDIKLSTGKNGNWTYGVRRDGGKNDQKIFEMLVHFIATNGPIFGKFIKGGFDTSKGGLSLGVLNKFLEEDLKDLNIDCYKMLRESLAASIYPYEEGKAETDIYKEGYEAAVGKKIDKIIFEDLIPELVTGDDGLIPGAVINETDKMDALLVKVFNVCWKIYLAPMLNELKIEYDEGNALAMAFKDVVELDFTTNPFDVNKEIPEKVSFLDGFCDFLGDVLKNIIIKGELNWLSGYSNIGQNIKNLFELLLNEADFSKTVFAAEAAAAKASTDFDAKVLIVVKAVLAQFGDEYGAAVQSCTSLKDMAFVVLKKVAKDEIGLDNTYAAGDDYLDVAADMLVYVADKIIPMDAVAGKELDDVINYIANFYLFDRGSQAAFNLKASKSDSGYDKLNSIIWIFYSSATPEAKRLDIETLLKGKDGKKSIFESILALDIQNIFDITIQPLVGGLKDYTASKLIYSIVKNVIDNVFGMTVIPAYVSDNPFDNLLQNANIAVVLENLLTALDKNMPALIPFGCYVACAIMDIPAVDWKIASGESYPDGTTSVKLTGKEIDGKTAISRVLYSGKDYEAVEGGIKGINSYEGKYYDVAFTAKKAPAAVTASSIKAGSITATGATLTWTAVSGATGYTVKNGSKKLADVTAAKYAVTGLTAGTTYKDITVTAFTKTPNGKTFTAAASKAPAFTTAPAAVKDLKASKNATTGLTLTWTASKTAAKYDVSYTASGKSVTKTVDKATIAITGLTANTAYKFTVTPKDSKGNKGAAASVSTRTLPGKVTGLKASSITATSLKLSWTAVKGATSYTVYNATTKKTVKSGVTGTSLSITGLSANKAYKFQVKATVKDSTGTYTGAYSDAKSATTLFTQTKGLKATKATTSAISITWTKVSGATSYKVYVNGKVYSTVKTNKATISKRSAGTVYSIYVVAYKSKVAGQPSATIKVAAAPAKATSLKGKSSGLGTKTVTLTWKAVKGATSYNIYQGSKKVGTATKATFAVKGLKRGTKYTFSVEAVAKTANYTSNGAKATVTVTA